MNTDSHGLRHEEKTRSVIGCAMEVLNALGHGFLEKVYENALCSDHELGQVLNYLKVTGLPVGLILNFKHAKLQWKRLVL